jgi:uncharacterized membrane protein
VIVVAIVIATALYALALSNRGDVLAAFRAYRQRVGRGILLGLEFLVAADIIRTVAVEPSYRGVGVLAIIVAIRTFLSFTLEVELEGHWLGNDAATHRPAPPTAHRQRRAPCKPRFPPSPRLH